MDTVISRDKTAIAYERAGSGDALILVDGAMSTREGPTKRELVDLLAPQFSVYWYDRRGRGDSGDIQPYAVQREIEDIEALIDLAGGQAYLFGHSSGGCLALEAAAQLGGKVQKVAAYEAPYNDDPVAQQAWGAYVRGLGQALADGRRGDAVALFMQYVGTPADQIAAMRQEPFWAGMEAIAPTLAYDHTALMGPTAVVPLKRLSAIRVPVLALCGGASYPFMQTTARTICHTVQNGTFRVLNGQGHAAQPEVVAPALIEFFQS